MDHTCAGRGEGASGQVSPARPGIALADAGAPRRIDPRVSIFVLMAINVQMIMGRGMATELAALALAVAAMAYCRRFFSIARWVALYAVFAVAAWALVMTRDIAFSPIAASVSMYRRILPAFMFGSNMIATTRLGELACALQVLRVPGNASVALCVAFRFLPTMGGEFRAVHEAMKVRGMALSPKALASHPIRTAERYLVPVVARVGMVADELGNAVVVRGMGSSARRTSYYRLEMGPTDAVFMAASSAMVVLAGCLSAGVF